MILRWFTLWLTVFVVIGAIGPKKWLDYYRLNRRGAVVPGIVLAKAPHMQFEYSFEVSGRRYTGIGRGYGDGRPAIGDEVAVYYLPDAPEINCLGNPQALFKHELLLELGVDSTFATMILVALIFRIRRSVKERD